MAAGSAMAGTPRVALIGAAGALAALVVADFALSVGNRYGLAIRMLTAVVVTMALTLAVTNRAALRFPATIGASAVSIAVSYAVAAAEGRRHPGGGLSLPRTELWPAFAELAGLGLLTGWNVRVARPVRAAAAAAAFAAVLWAQVGWRMQDRLAREAALLAMALWLVVVGAGLYLRWLDARQLLHAERARSDERLEIARELHDLVAHHVTGIVVQAQAAQLVADRQPDATVRALARIEHAGGEALAAMRTMVGALRRDGATAERAPTASLRDLGELATPATPGHPAVEVALDGRADSLPAELAAAFHRIAREAVANARRHGVGATRIAVGLTVRDGAATLQVDDDGRGAGAHVPATATSGFGLLGMAERATALGGTFSAGPRPLGDGWTVVASVPIPPGPPRSGSSGPGPPAPSSQPLEARR